MPFGLNKKDKEADLAKDKKSLFGSRSKSSTKAPASQSSNPYAAQSQSNDPLAGKSSNPYANEPKNDPYAPGSSASIRSSQPPTSSFGNLSLNSEAGGPPPSYPGSSASVAKRDDKSPVPSGGYGGGAPRYQSQGSYGAPQGYGSDPYNNGQGQQQQQQQQSRYGPSGYGGLGRSNSQDTMATDAGRNALFGDAPQRAAAQPPQQQDESYGNAGSGYGSTASGVDGMAGAYGGYGAESGRQLTEEEQEEQDVTAAKSEIKFIKQQDVSSTRNARRAAEQAEITGRETLARLGAQGERIHNTEKNLGAYLLTKPHVMGSILEK